MKAGVCNWTFKQGNDFDIVLVFKGRDLRAAAILIVIKRRGTGEVYKSSATDGVLSVSYSGDDSTIIWKIPYTATGAAIVQTNAYEYDVEITESGARYSEVEGTITVTKNV
jgi:hypothetical protein